MNNGTKTKNGLVAIIALIILAAYNIVLFAVCGFDGHSGAFWLSYVFMMIAFLSLAFNGFIMRGKVSQPNAWFLGLSVLKHCGVYLVVELIVSTVFIALDYIDCPWVVAFVVQTVLLAVHLVFVISCFASKKVIVNIGEKAKQKTSAVKLLMIDAEMIATSSSDAEVKDAFNKLAEQIRYSDPMSHEMLADLESRIANLLEQGKLMSDKKELLIICNNISSLLRERNEKCKVLK